MAVKELAEALEGFSHTVDEVKSCLHTLNLELARLHSNLSNQLATLVTGKDNSKTQKETESIVRHNTIELNYVTAQLKYGFT
jgi:hypothetical protein